VTGRSQVLAGGTRDDDSYEMVNKPQTTIVGRSRRDAGESEEDILKAREGSGKDEVYVTKTVAVNYHRGV
jgi:hypothetical protein